SYCTRTGAWIGAWPAREGASCSNRSGPEQPPSEGLDSAGDADPCPAATNLAVAADPGQNLHFLRLVARVPGPPYPVALRIRVDSGDSKCYAGAPCGRECASHRH